MDDQPLCYTCENCSSVERFGDNSLWVSCDITKKRYQLCYIIKCDAYLYKEEKKDG